MNVKNKEEEVADGGLAAENGSSMPFANVADMDQGPPTEEMDYGGDGGDGDNFEGGFEED